MNLLPLYNDSYIIHIYFVKTTFKKQKNDLHQALRESAAHILN